MQSGQIREQFSRVQQCIANATQLCKSTKDVPEELRSSLSELDRASHQALQTIEQQRADEGIDQCVDRLEELGDRIIEACKRSGSVDWDVQSAVRDAHDAISELKHRLH